MVKLSVCIEMMWPGMAPDDKVRRVKALGFSAYEIWSWSDKDLARLKAAQDETGLVPAVTQLEPVGGLTEPDDSRDLAGMVAKSAAAAHKLNCNKLIVLTGNVIGQEPFEITRRRVVRKLKVIARAAADHGVIMLLEPLNPIVDHRGFWLTKMNEAADILAEVDSPCLKILDDLYHQQLTEGNLIANLQLHAPLIGHYHTAGVPGRHELSGGELDYRGIFAAIDKTGYQGYVGLEFSPTMGEDAALKQALELARGAR